MGAAPGRNEPAGKMPGSTPIMLEWRTRLCKARSCCCCCQEDRRRWNQLPEPGTWGGGEAGDCLLKERLERPPCWRAAPVRLYGYYSRSGHPNADGVYSPGAACSPTGPVCPPHPHPPPAPHPPTTPCPTHPHSPFQSHTRTRKPVLSPFCSTLFCLTPWYTMEPASSSRNTFSPPPQEPARTPSGVSPAVALPSPGGRPRPPTAAAAPAPAGPWRAKYSRIPSPSARSPVDRPRGPHRRRREDRQ